MNNNHYRLLVADIDGTLLNRFGEISTWDAAAVARVREAGIGIALSTGRSARSCTNIIRELSLDSYHVFFDGALVCKSDLSEEVYAKPLNRVLVKEMIEFVHSHGIDLELFSASHYFVERETWSTEAHRRFFGVDYTRDDFSNISERERIIKGGLVFDNAAVEAKIIEFERHFGDRLYFSRARTPRYPGVTFINILMPRVSKGEALEALCSFLKVPLEQVVAVGDGTNDITLLNTAGLAIAMGNAPDEVKETADHITLDVEHNGLAAAIDRFLLSQ